MVGRLLCTLSIIATVAVQPVCAQSVTDIAWNRNGLLTWQRVEHRTIAPQTIRELSVTLAPGRSKTTVAGRPGVLEVVIRYTQRDGGSVRRTVLWSRVVRAARPRIVAVGVSATSLAAFEARGVARMTHMAQRAIEMLATAYTAACSGCGGMTAIGRRAGYGIVAVDPRVIPLGTRLYIPGYGLAVAGDTGGSIVGRRIDLGFDSTRDAMMFGRRAVTVYPLK